MKKLERQIHVRLSRVIAMAAAIILAGPAVVWAHAVVFPRESLPGAYERYMLRVPNEKGVATTRVELRFPAQVRVTSFEDVPGWTLEVETDSAQRIVGAVWTGTLAPKRFIELPFVAVNPKDSVRVAWPAYQTYADGERVEWTGEQGSKSPASVTRIAAAAVSVGRGGQGWVSWAALLLSLVALGLSLRRPEVRPAA